MTDDLIAQQRRLNAAQDRKRRRALGPALRLSDAALDTLATVGDADVPVAEALWRAANPGVLSDLLNATSIDDA